MIGPTPDFGWSEYFERERHGQKHPIFDRLNPFLKRGSKALDLGCGVGHGTAYLALNGLHVTAVDISPEALDSLRAQLVVEPSPKLILSDFVSLSFEQDSFDVIVATNALYFLSPLDFEQFWPRVRGWLKPGGVFAGQFMGPNDSWAFRNDYSCQTLATIQKLFEGFEFLDLNEDERDSENMPGKPSHVHIFHVIARKSSILDS